MDAVRSRKRIVKLVRRRARLVVVLGLAATMLASVVSMVLPKTYLVTARLVASPVDNMTEDGLVERVNEAASEARGERALGDIGGRVLATESGGSPADVAARRDALVQEIREHTAIESHRESGSGWEVVISHRGSDAAVGVQVVAGLVDVFQKKATDRSTAQQEQTVAVVAKAEDEARAAAEGAAAEHVKYRDENIEFLDGVHAKLEATQRDMKALETEIATLERQKKEAEELLEKEPPFVLVKVRQADPAHVRDLDDKIKEINDQLTQLRSVQGLSDEHATVKAILVRLAGLEEEKKKIVDAAPLVEQRKANDQYETVAKELKATQSKLVAANLRRQSLRNEERDQKEQARRAPDIEAKEKVLLAAVETTKQELATRAAATENARRTLEEFRTRGSVAVVQTDPPTDPISNGPAGPGALLLALAGLGLGTVAGLATALVSGATDRSFTEAETVAHFLGIPTVGAIHLIQTPAEAAQRRKFRRRQMAQVAALAVVAAVVVVVAAWEPQAIADLVKSRAG